MSTFYTVISMLSILGYYLLVGGITIRILMKRRTVASATAWLLIIFFLPLVGIVAYILIGELNLGSRRAERAQSMWPITSQWLAELKNCPNIFSTSSSEVAEPLFQLCEKRQGISAIQHNQLQLLTTYESTIKSLIRDIEVANSHIEMVFYIWTPGGLADSVAEALISAARRGVHCRVMLDSAGSRTFFRSAYPRKMHEAGIEIVEALKVSIFRALLRRMDLRQHRKLILIDNYIAYTGSMNMVDPRFFKQNAGVGQWIDLMARIEGPVASMLGVIYACDWEMETGHHQFPALPESNIFPFEHESGHTVHVIPSGPGFPEEMIHQALLTAVYSSRKQLIMTTPYFVPSDDLLHAICTAALRGVNVSIIVPAKNDSMMVNWASRAFYSELLEAGVKIYKFTGGLLHTKSVLVDGQLSLVGTVNLDMRSLWLNFELTVAVDDQDFGNDLSYVQSDYIASSTLLTLDEWQKRPVWNRIIERVFYFFSPLL